MSQILTYVDENRRRFVEELRTLIRFPSISAVPAHAKDVRACADWLVAHLRELGMTVELHPTAGHPLVYAEWLGAPGAPTVLIYGHYDVQPVDPLALWKHPPFEAVVVDNTLIARGATDDKGQVFAHVKALDAFFHTEGRLPVNVKLVIEGEEEVGSEHLDTWVEANREKLACDVLVISDTAQYGDGIPAITVGLRGIAYFEVRVDGPAADLHSGVFGGAVDNPLNVLCGLIAGLKDADGRITVAGFYDDVRPLTAAERAAFTELPNEDAGFQAAAGVPRLTGETGYTTLERRWARPTCDLNGIFGGYQGEGAKTVLPAWGGAKLSFRLVPDQEPERIAALVRRHFETHVPDTCRVTVTYHHGGRPVLVPSEGPAMQAARRALARGFGREPVLIREGGSIPVVQTFQAALGAPVLLLGFGRNDDGAHSPNEKFSLDDYHHGIRSSACLLAELGAK